VSRSLQQVRVQQPKFAALLIACFVLTSPGRSQDNVQIVHGQRPPAVAQLKPLARLAPSKRLDLVVGLPLRNRAALASLLHDLYDPASPRYHKYLTPSEFAERFSPTERDYQAIADFATSHGLGVSGTHPNRTLLDINGSVADIEKTFHVRMEVYQHPSEARSFYAPDTDPSINLDVPMLGIQGLDNFALPRPMNLITPFDSTNVPAAATGSGPSGYYIGGDFRAAYAPGVALTGAGQSVGLFELDGYYASDIFAYEDLARLPNVTLTNILLNGFDGTPGTNEIEVTLDIDMVISMAPGLSQVLVYEGTNPDDILNRMATEDRASQLSCSWGFGSVIDTNREQIYMQFAAQGQTMFQASGSSGAYSGEPEPPSDDPNLTVVGGTLLTTKWTGGPWSAETAWSGSGGGSSTNFPLPTWQSGLSTSANQGSTAFRNIPDVAGVAGVSIWLIADGGQQGPIGGTSAAAPMWAGFAALANQQAVEQGKPAIGFINPTLYAIGRSAEYPSIFHDITAGNNTNAASPSNYFAVPGYDLCTGWGSPAGSNLINALISPPDALQIFPATNLIATGGTGGPFNPPAQTMVLTNIGAASVNWKAVSAVPWLSVAPITGALSSGGPSAAVTLSLNSAANNLAPGSYTATIWFTNRIDGFAQSRQLILDVLVTSSVPVIVSQPLSQTVLPGAAAVFAVTAVGDAPLSYQWRENSANLSDTGNITGSTNATLTISDVSSASAATYSVIVSNALGQIASTGAVLTVASVAAPGVTISNLYSFTGAVDGANPNGLVQYNNGSFYGTTQNGGSNSSGTIFQMTPAGVVTTLDSFNDTGAGGFAPEAGLVQGADGNLYGTTELGGANGFGTIFKTTTNGNLTTVYSFDGGDGAFPDEPMILATDGNFYGSTSSGGIDGDGEIFRLSPKGALIQFAWFDYVDGLNPNKLVQGTDGSLYGTAFDGGTNGDGLIFDVATNGAMATLYSFSFAGGGLLPSAGLAQAPGGSFYGTTYEGGTYGNGTAFTMSPDSVVTTVYSFTGGNDGSHPSADLVQAADGNFYGTTVDGGAYNYGTVFRWAPGGELVTLLSFDGYNGANPQTPLVQGTDGSLYGTTQNGGASGNGAIFRVNINSTNVQITGQPAGQSAFFGANAVFSVAVQGNPPLYYQWSKNGTNLTDGGNISDSTTRVLTVSDVGPGDLAIYAVTVSNAAGQTATSDGAFLGVILSPPQFITPLASQTATVGGTAELTASVVGDLPLFYQWQSNQVNLTDGPDVFGVTTPSLTLRGLTQQSSATYSMVVSNAVGTVSAEATLTVYPVSVPGSVMASLYWFTGGADGGVPNGLTFGTNGILYGTTQTGGDYNDGTIFSITTNGHLQTLVQFNSTNGSNPQAALVQGTDGNFYGTTQDGGTNAGGTVFVMTTNGLLTTLVAFSNQTGINPYTALVQGTNGNFYGAAENNAKPGNGNIFEMTPSGTVDVVYSFTGGLDGNEPVSSLTQGADSNFYGLTTAGGAYNYGGIFQMTSDGALTNLYSFTGGTDGYNPYGALVQGTDGDFYGVTRRDAIQGLQFDGTIFKVTTNGALTTLYALNPLYNGDGEYPFAGLLQAADGNFYGTTLYTESNMNGTVFRITPDGVFATLAAFNGSDDGAEPKAAMVQDADGNFYGTTTAGGPYGKGSIFRLTITSAPQITIQPSNQTVFTRTSAQFYVAVFGASPLRYQWQKNGNGLADGGGIVGSSTRILTVNNVTQNDAGTYSVIVTNLLGSVTSSGAVLTIMGAPPVFQSVALGGGMLSLTWSAAPAQTYQVQSTTNLASGGWTNVGGVITATSFNVSESYETGSASQQFYRVLLLP
jgi:uncharacterized repeat protein (TIGR03803 family)